MRRRIVDEAPGPVARARDRSRKPGRPGVVTVANECHSRSGLRLIPTAEANAGLTPWSKCTITACEEGRSTVTGTRRSRSHGETMLAVTSASTPTCQPGASAPGGASAPRRARLRSSRRSGVRARTRRGRGCARPAPRSHDDDGERDEAPRENFATVVTSAGVAIATAAKAHSHDVPASAAPAWIPPTWCTFETPQRSHSGHDREPRPASPNSALSTLCWRMSTATRGSRASATRAPTARCRRQRTSRHGRGGTDSNPRFTSPTSSVKRW